VSRLLYFPTVPNFVPTLGSRTAKTRLIASAWGCT